MGFIFAALFAGYSPKITPMAKQKIAASATTPPLSANCIPASAAMVEASRRMHHERKNSDDAPEHAENDRFHEELQQYGAAARADGLADADSRVRSSDGDEHDVHNADAADDEDMFAMPPSRDL